MFCQIKKLFQIALLFWIVLDYANVIQSLQENQLGESHVKIRSAAAGSHLL